MVTSSIQDQPLEFYDDTALMERLTFGLKTGGKQVVFIVGSALTAPSSIDQAGVPGVAGVIELIKAAFDEDQRALLESQLVTAENSYQEAFKFLIGRRGQQAANDIIRKAVAAARLVPDGPESGLSYHLSSSTNDEVCRSFDNDFSGWFLPSGVKALGSLAAGYPETFGRTCLTTNFDPLLGASVRAAGGATFRTILHSDGRLGQADGNGWHVVHLHGYWYGSDTLHTPRQLGQPRPQLKASLAHLIRDKTVVVVGYGGWDDAFTRALMDVVVDDSAFPEVIWTFRDKSPVVRPHLLRLLEPGLNRARVTLYGGVDCHSFLPQLLCRWHMLEAPRLPTQALPNLAQTPINYDPGVTLPESVLPFDLDGDRPPQSPFYVGRESEIASLRSSPFRVGFITGIGGQGKSVLAAQFFGDADTLNDFDHRVWRDCKEESERFENHIVSVVRSLGRGHVAGIDLAKQSMANLAIIFGRLTKDRKVLAIFDNVDHYVDLEKGVIQGAAAEFIECFLKSNSKARLIFTCRPSIQSTGSDQLSLRLEGMSLNAAAELFRLRNASADASTVSKIFTLTSGHAFWIDLVAAQFARNASQHQKEELFNSVSTGGGAIPDATLRSIWNNLQDRQQIVLQALAEALRPTTLIQLEDYLSARIRYNQISKALKSLQELSLVVVKPETDGRIGYELHPLIRAFIKSTFPREKRIWYIDAILVVYGRFFGKHRAELEGRPNLDTLNYWLEGAELYINAGKYELALKQLDEVSSLFLASAPPGEFIRVGELLIQKMTFAEGYNYKYFDSVFSAIVHILANLGRTQKASSLLSQYRETISGKDARYVNFCDLQAYVFWRSGEFQEAIRWGTEGFTLKSSSGVDTSYTPEHTLALARRDSGEIDLALNFFLGGLSLEEVVDSNHISRDRGGTFYGNVGRCLQLMGQIEPALRCYQKSAQLIEEDTKDHEENRAYVRQWIGEMLALKGDFLLALNFFVAAKAKWSLVAPPKAGEIETIINRVFVDNKISNLPSDLAAEVMCKRWISIGH